MKRKLLVVLLGLFAVSAVAVAAATAGQAPANLPVIGDDNLKPQYTHVGGADPTVTDKTVAHWFGTFNDPTNNQSYGYNMVGVDPGTSGSATVPVDVIPLNIVFDSAGGAGLNGSDAVTPTIGSPIFQSNDYSSTTKSTGGPGELSSGNVGQYEDAVMRSQFNKVGTAYHLNFGTPVTWPTVTFDVPQNQGFLAVNSRGVELGLMSISWFSAQLNNLMNGLNLDPTHLPIFLTNNVMLYIGKPGNCCVIGYHGAAHSTGAGTGKTHSNSGSTALQTFAYAAYTTPGTFASYYVKDIHALSHEIAEWGDDPFVNNTVNPWLTPTAPQYGCTGILETGDPVVGIGFDIGTNTFDSGSFADGAYHPEDEVFLPWFARQSPNTTSQHVQGGTTGRYTFMGNLNPFPGFQVPATGC